MLRMRMIFDESVFKSKHYSKQKAIEQIDYCARKCNLIKKGEGIYYGNDTEEELSDMGIMMESLRNIDWFMEIIKEWVLEIEEDGIWYDDGDILADYCGISA